MPLRAIMTEGTMADCSQGIALIMGYEAENLLADRGYDTDAIIEYAKNNTIHPVIPPKRNRKEPREYDKELYKAQHLVENAFFKLKAWRGIATRFAKTQLLFWQLSKSDIFTFGLQSRDYTLQSRSCMPVTHYNFAYKNILIFNLFFA